MAESYKVCPICETHNHRNAMVCNTCGASLAQVKIIAPKNGKSKVSNPDYDFRYGETDLYEGSVTSVGRNFTAGIFVLGILLGVGIAVAIFGPSFLSQQQMPISDSSPTPSPTLRIVPTVTQGIATVTQTLTPTITFTPTETYTPEPCVRVVVAGDSLTGIVLNCGHRSRDVIPTVMALNGIADETLIQVGQQIFVPWPTATIDPNITPTDTPEGSLDNGGDAVAFFVEDPFAPTATPTLLPGVTWHRVQPNENMIIVASQYGANAKVLSELNPEIDFPQCDFGLTFGGPECNVQLREGQLVRVPAPTPTATIQPSPSGNETATPSATPTFNVPNSISPSNQEFFGLSDQVTLRWVATGTLAINEVYHVAVSDVTSGATYTADSRDLFFILPDDWQAKDDTRHTYIWQVSVIREDNPAQPLYTTETRTFVWQGTGENKS